MNYKNREEFNLALLTDLYQLTMMQGYFYYKRDLNVVCVHNTAPLSGHI